MLSLNDSQRLDINVRRRSSDQSIIVDLFSEWTSREHVQLWAVMGGAIVRGKKDEEDGWTTFRFPESFLGRERGAVKFDLWDVHGGERCRFDAEKVKIPPSEYVHKMCANFLVRTHVSSAIEGGVASGIDGVFAMLNDRVEASVRKIPSVVRLKFYKSDNVTIYNPKFHKGDQVVLVSNCPTAAVGKGDLYACIKPERGGWVVDERVHVRLGAGDGSWLEPGAQLRVKNDGTHAIGVGSQKPLGPGESVEVGDAFPLSVFGEEKSNVRMFRSPFIDFSKRHASADRRGDAAARQGANSGLATCIRLKHSDQVMRGGLWCVHLAQCAEIGGAPPDQIPISLGHLSSELEGVHAVLLPGEDGIDFVDMGSSQGTSRSKHAPQRGRDGRPVFCEEEKLVPGERYRLHVGQDWLRMGDVLVEVKDKLK